jgi:hypothetical protein
VRQVFFPHPDQTLGTPSAPVQSQAAAGYPEESRSELAGVSFASLHIVGSNNSLAPWTGQTTPTSEQTAEVLGRTADSIAVIRGAFATARAHGDRAVALRLQADMFDPTVPNPSYADYYGFTPIVQAIAQESRAYGKPVYLFNGDSHTYQQDHPLAAGSPWLGFYGIAGIPVSNVHPRYGRWLDERQQPPPGHDQPQARPLRGGADLGTRPVRPVALCSRTPPRVDRRQARPIFGGGSLVREQHLDAVMD